MKRLYRLSIFLLLLLHIQNSFSQSIYFPAPESEGGWRVNTDADFVQSLGLRPDKLQAFGEYNLSVPNSNWKPYSDYKGIIVIKDGWIVGEWYNKPEAKDFKTYLSSNGKSFAIAMFGIAMKDGMEGKIDTHIQPESHVYSQKLLPQGFPLSDPRKKDITFEQIFQHTSGLCPERTASGDTVEQGRNSWTNYVDWVVGHDEKWPWTAPLYFDPGQPQDYDGHETWGEHAGAYSSVGFAHVGLVVQNLYQMPASQFLWNRLLEPIGFSGIDYHAPPNDEIRWFSAGGLRMTPRDYARFGYFLLHDGNWNGNQIVPEGWIKRFRTKPNYPNIRSNVDGYFGRQYPKDMFRIAGSGINLCFMIPSLNLIALRTGRCNNGMWDEVEQTFLTKLFDAVAEQPQPQTGTDPIIADPGDPRWLIHKSGKPFFMCGPGDPEGFLYRGALNEDGTRKGDQKELIEKLIGTGANCIYLQAVRSHGGDGDETHNPFIGNDPAKGINEKVLDQWEEWFSLMDRNGIVIYFFIYDDSAVIWNPKGSENQDEMSEEEKTFIQTLVKRFQHHSNLIWCIGEEYSERYTKERARRIAAWIRECDEYDHAIAVHQLTQLTFDFPNDPNIDQFAIQLIKEGTQADWKTVHSRVVEAWHYAQGRYSLNMSELAGHMEHSSHETVRRRNWASAMGGAYVMVLGMDIASTPVKYLKDCGRLNEFFQTIDIRGLAPHDEQADGGTDFVLADPENRYVLYAGDSDRYLGLKSLRPGSYSLQWYNPADGEWIKENKVIAKHSPLLWQRPESIEEDAALYIVPGNATARKR